MLMPMEKRTIVVNPETAKFLGTEYGEVLEAYYSTSGHYTLVYQVDGTPFIHPIEESEIEQILSNNFGQMEWPEVPAEMNVSPSGNFFKETGAKKIIMKMEF